MTSSKFFLKPNDDAGIQGRGLLEQQWVRYQVGEKVHFLLSVPNNQIETIMLLSKLDSLRALPFTTLSANYSENNIEILAKYLDTKVINNNTFKLLHCCCKISDLESLKLISSHTNVIICWEIDPKISREKLDDITYNLQVGDKMLPVIILSELPGLCVYEGERLE
jgi:hypothetical protein